MKRDDHIIPGVCTWGYRIRIQELNYDKFGSCCTRGCVCSVSGFLNRIKCQNVLF